MFSVSRGSSHEDDPNLVARNHVRADFPHGGTAGMRVDRLVGAENKRHDGSTLLDKARGTGGKLLKLK